MATRYKRKTPGRRRRTFIAKWREKAGLNKRQLAERLDVSEATQSRYESGDLPLSLDYLEDCARALGCTAVDLISRDPSARPDTAMQRAIDLLKEAAKDHP